MSNNIQLFNYGDFAVRIIQRDDVLWFVAKDVCRILDIKNHRDAIKSLDDDEKIVSEIPTPSNGGFSNVILISESGLYALIFRSNKPEAKDFSRWVRKDVLPQIRRTGTYSINNSINQDELELRRKDLDLRGALILQNMIEHASFPITPETRTVFAHEVFKLVTGHSYLAMLPESSDKWYTASDIGAEFGLSANMVGRIAKSNGIKAPDGESNEYGRWIFSKSKYSSREVPSFIYSEAGREWFRQYQLEYTKGA